MHPHRAPVSPTPSRHHPPGAGTACLSGSAPGSTRARRLRALLRDCRGIVALEFAIVVPAVLLLFSAVWAAMTLQLAAVALEGGTAAAARVAVTGNLPAAGSREDAIREIITRHVCPKALGLSAVCYWDGSGLFSDNGVPTSLEITITAYVDPRNIGRPEPFVDENGNGIYDEGEPFTDLNGNGQWDADMGATGAGGAGDHVLYDVRMTQAVRHPLLIPLYGRTRIHRAQLIVRNEPY